MLEAATLQNGATGKRTTEGDGEETDAGVAESQSSQISGSIEGQLHQRII